MKQIIEKEEKARGRFITCKYCKHKFKFFSEETKLLWVDNKFICPSCKQFYCNKSETEKKLFELQDEFLISNDMKYLNEISLILNSYGMNLFLKIFGKKFAFDIKDVKYYVENSVSLLVEEIYCVKKKVITDSFSGFLVHKMRQALYGKKEKPLKNTESIDYIYSDKNHVQYEDTKSYASYIEDDSDINFLINTLYEIIIRISDYSDSPFENYMRELALDIHLTKGEKYANKFYRVYHEKGICDKPGKLFYLYTLEILKNKLKKEVEI